MPRPVEVYLMRFSSSEAPAITAEEGADRGGWVGRRARVTVGGLVRLSLGARVFVRIGALAHDALTIELAVELLII